jgi:predicted transcriptional regulator
LSIRVPAEHIAEADALAKRLASTRSDVMRAALVKGLAMLRAETKPRQR